MSRDRRSRRSKRSKSKSKAKSQRGGAFGRGKGFAFGKGSGMPGFGIAGQFMNRVGSRLPGMAGMAAQGMQLAQGMMQQQQPQQQVAAMMPQPQAAAMMQQPAAPSPGAWGAPQAMPQQMAMQYPSAPAQMMGAMVPQILGNQGQILGDLNTSTLGCPPCPCSRTMPMGGYPNQPGFQAYGGKGRSRRRTRKASARV